MSASVARGWGQSHSKLLECAVRAVFSLATLAQSWDTSETSRRPSNGCNHKNTSIQADLSSHLHVISVDQNPTCGLDHNSGDDVCYATISIESSLTVAVKHFDWDVYLFHPKGKAIGPQHHKIQAVACLDTQCRVNWIFVQNSYTARYGKRNKRNLYSTRSCRLQRT